MRRQGQAEVRWGCSYGTRWDRGYGDTVTTAAATASSEVPLASAFIRGGKPAG